MKLPWDHPRTADRHSGKYVRERSADPYHTSRWTRLSLAFRTEHPLCAECARQGRVRAATCVDHITPYPLCKDFYDRSNLQSLCDECNHLKGQRDKKLIQEYKKKHDLAKVQL